jgi:hypothetical protein
LIRECPYADVERTFPGSCNRFRVDVKSFPGPAGGAHLQQELAVSTADVEQTRSDARQGQLADVTIGRGPLAGYKPDRERAERRRRS